MIRAIQLVFAPALAWGNIVRANRGVLTTLILSLLPLLLVTAAVEGWSAMARGLMAGPIGARIKLSREQALTFEGFQVLLSLALVFFVSLLVKWVCEGFHIRTTFQRCFTIAAFGLSPVFLTRLVNVIPSIHPWAGWALGACLTVVVLYQGVAIVLEPEQTKGFGIYIMIAIILLAMSGLTQFLVMSFLNKQI